MKIVRMHIDKLLTAVFFWLDIFLCLAVFNINAGQALNLAGFSFLIIAPGLLTVIALRLRNLDFWGYAAVIAGISILELMAMALIGNWLLPQFGIEHPLQKNCLLGELLIMTVALGLFCRKRAREISIPVRRFWLFDTAGDLVLAAVPAIFPVLAVLGAIRINNGGGNELTLLMLAGIAAYSAVLVKKSGKSGANTIPTALFFVSLAMLLMTSMRGWFATGHDIQHEYLFFEIVKNSGIWSAANSQDAYNACLSVTVLPTVFSNFLQIADPYVYKVFFQIVFAIVPVIVYLAARRYLVSAIAAVSALCFIFFPTFYGDMPFLNRQEIAFLFFALMIYAIFEQRLAVSVRRFLFLLFGAGMIVSHYSTTYAAIAVFVFLAFAYPITRAAFPRMGKMKIFADSGFAGLRGGVKLPPPLITVWMLVFAISATFLWTSAFTKTATGSIYKVIQETISTMKSNAREDAKSNDVLFSLFSFKKPPTAAELLQDYQKDISASAQALGDQENFYDPAQYGGYRIEAVDIPTLPLTPAGRALAAAGIDVAALAYILHQALARMMQLFVVAGFVFAIFKSKFIAKPVAAEFALLAAGSIGLLAAFVLLPTISAEYGIFRAFQQLLIFLGVFMAIGIAIPAARFRKVGTIFAVAFMAILLFVETGAVTAVFGGYNPKLNLNNAGSYYDTYYIHSGEIAGAEWLVGQIEKSGNLNANVQADYFVANIFTQAGIAEGLFPENSVYPAVVKKDSYVILGFTNATRQKSAVFYKGNLFTYTYPVHFLADNKDVIYDNRQTAIYR